LLAIVPLFAVWACNTSYLLVGEKDGSAPTNLTGGAGSGGTTADAAAGGSSATGGASPAGGAFATGGASHTGGASTGGASSTGGAASTGGTAGGEEPAPTPLAISARTALTRLSRVLWETEPNAALLATADFGGLTTDADVRRIAREMLTDPLARVGVGHFFRWWLDLDNMPNVIKDPVLFPGYTSGVGNLMASETETFGSYVTVDGDARFSTLMQAPFSFVNASLAPFYGLGNVVGSSLRKTDLDATSRAGLVTQLAFLTQTTTQGQWTSPTRRGLFVRRKFLCQELPPPPPTAPTTLPPVSEQPQTGRQRLEAATAVSSDCKSCHVLTDPLGFVFETFDSVGRVRTMDAGLPIDSAGYLRLSSASDIDYVLSGPVDLARVLTNLGEVHHCMGTQWLQYALGHGLTDAHAPDLTFIQQRFEATGLDLRELIVAVVASGSFLAANGGPPCQAGVGGGCNDDPRLSSIHGTCTAGGKCVCSGTYQLNPMTGRCL